MTDLTLETLRAELAPIQARLSSIDEQLVPMRARLKGLPLIQRAVTVIRQEQRLLKGAFPAPS